jgi:acyl-coenzyme A synthetase/AMP-(fatty) acid ligase
MRVKIVFAATQLEWPSTSWTLDDDETQIWINELAFTDNLDVFGSQFTYSICTSGTTGQPKSVLVPPEAIMPNVQDFM